MGDANCSKGWGARCAAARSKRCRCACGGANHGGASHLPAEGGGDIYKLGEVSPESVIYYRPNEEREHSWSPRAGAIRAIRFTRGDLRSRGNLPARGRAIIEVMYLDHGERLVQRYVKHSPDGFEFGYHGSGPSDTALNLLALFIPVKEATRDGMYHIFKDAFVAAVDQEKGGEVSGAAIRDWIAGTWKANDAREAANRGEQPWSEYKV